MKILYVCHRFPFPPKRGGKIRPFNMIKHLSQQHEVHVCSLARSAAEADEGKGLREFCAHTECAVVSKPWQTLRMIIRLPVPTPSSMGYFYSPELKQRIRQLHAEHRYDLIFVHCSSVAQYVEDIDDAVKVLDFGDMDSQKWLEYAHYKPFPLNLGYWWEGKKMERAERRLSRKFDYCTATTRMELATLRELSPGLASDWFPNGVNSSVFAPDGSDYDDDTISFIGRMDYYPNQECMVRFCKDVLPKIQAVRPSAKLVIVGADPSAEIRALGKLPGVIVTGSVPEVQPYVRRSAVMVAPLAIARGTQNKILEALAMGVPVVTSSLAADGVDCVAGEHLLVADSANDIAAAVLSLMQDRNKRQQLAEAGRARMLSHHHWPQSMLRLDAILAEAQKQASLRRGNAAPARA
ncbi:TIGR03087 family PEP-CTERM/XrtA system glycosyltransferase [Permianibacter sp. IMCC34836]|uniref:TIGR03087 family PEP-CTERM/XrtA system glycosyltransferase n=1 Tax=Permianibacter fluminis TaxID=2738515 RepID=UPI0015536406|nr:TIGR03087 family PEP-CTERM/XrtA system glycosyltransferase [Permianibacter fluminis]NQD35591.1 TIGR03087 family PEP-CTERM/XrtA system glycosyltransferase [Permianibacter fluminis]